MQRAVLVLALVVGVSGTTVPEWIIGALRAAQIPVTPRCQQQFGEFFANFSMDQNSWALQMVDATSKIPSGLLSLNFGEMGDFEECINVKASTGAGTILGKYCLGYLALQNTTSSPHGQTLGTSSLGNSGTDESAMSLAPVWALCLPDGCTTDDANVVGNLLLANITGNQIGVGFSDSLCQTVKEVNPPLTGGAIATIVILALLLSAIVLSTLYDLFCVFYSQKSCPMLVKGFSAYNNTTKLFKMTTSTPDQLPCLNGLKCLSMVWVVAGHQFSVPMNGSITNSKYMLEWTENLYSMFLVSGTLSVDTFFTIGGALLSYGFLKSRCKNTPFNLFLYYLHRYLRLTAPLALVVLVSATLLKYMGSGPKWPFAVMSFQEYCVDNWWSTLLYVQNYVNITNMCVGQTWYLNIDFQLYLISPAVLFALWKYPKMCLSFLVLCVLGFIGGSFYVAWANDLTAILTNLYGNSYNYQNKYYLLTHTRSAPWVIGVILGTVVWVMWGVSVGTLLACVLGGHSTLRGEEYDRWGNAFHIALVRPVWSLAISWVILACTNDYGGPVNWVLSLPIYQVLGRFTYSIYLTHVTMLYVITFGKQWPDYFSNFNMAYQFWGTLWFSAGLSYLLILMTESPIIVIEKMLFGSFGKKKQPKKDVESGVDNAAFEK